MSLEAPLLLKAGLRAARAAASLVLVHSWIVAFDLSQGGKQVKDELEARTVLSIDRWRMVDRESLQMVFD